MAGPDEIQQLLSESLNASIFEELRSRVSRGAVVPFVGAGLSMPFQYPAWSELLRQQARGVGLTVEVEAHVAGGQFEEAASLLQSKLGAGFSELLRLAFSPTKLKGRHIDGAPQVLTRIFRGPVVTSNYDEVLERAYEQEGYGFEEVAKPPDEEWLSEAFSGNRHFLLKIHGHWAESSSRILTLEQYEWHYGGGTADSFDLSRGLPQALHLMFLSRSVLFLGCSLYQDRYLQVLVKLLADRWRVPSHYALLERPRTERQCYERRSQLMRLKIMPIFFPPGRFDLIPEILQRLGPDEVEDEVKADRGVLAPPPPPKSKPKKAGPVVSEPVRSVRSETIASKEKTRGPSTLGPTERHRRSRPARNLESFAAIDSSRRRAGPSLRITVYGPGRPAQVYTFDEPQITIGRRQGNDLVISATGVSYHHALVRVTDDGLKITDTGSTNGTWVNGKRVHDTTLRPDDDVEIAGHRLRFERIGELESVAARLPRPSVPSPAEDSAGGESMAPPEEPPLPVTEEPASLPVLEALESAAPAVEESEVEESNVEDPALTRSVEDSPQPPPAVQRPPMKTPASPVTRPPAEPELHAPSPEIDESPRDAEFADASIDEVDDERRLEERPQRFELVPPPGLIDALRRGRCVLFAGEDASLDAGLPSRPELVWDLIEVADRAGVLEEGEAEALRQLVDRGDVYAAQDRCRARLSAEQMRSFIRLRLDVRGRYSPSHQLLARVPFRCAVTTNLDSFLERSRPGATVLLPEAIEALGRGGVAAELTGSPGFVVIKLHGSSDEPDLLLSDDPSEDTRSRPGTREFLVQLLSTHHVFFYGHRFADERVGGLLRAAVEATGGSGPEHYALLGEHDPAVIESIRHEHGVVAITEPDGVTHRETLAFLEQLQVAVDG